MMSRLWLWYTRGEGRLLLKNCALATPCVEKLVPRRSSSCAPAVDSSRVCPCAAGRVALASSEVEASRVALDSTGSQ